jgi:hypothetical protein
MVAGLTKSVGCQLVIHVLGCQTQKWARVTMNKNHKGSKAQSKQYMTGWTGLLHLVSESTHWLSDCANRVVGLFKKDGL